jgi:hypothetical protein
MAEIINLRQRRKQRARNAKAVKAEQNRIWHGRTKAEKQSAEANHARHSARLDGHKLTGDDD